MSMNNKLPPPPLEAAGMLMLRFNEHQLAKGKASRATTLKVVARTRGLLNKAVKAGYLVKDPHRFLAVKLACDILERRTLDANDDVTSEQVLFDAAVENHQGTATRVQLGGRRIKHKKSAKENFLRAVCVVLWEEHKLSRDQLARDARKHLGVKNRKALRKIVENHTQRHDTNLEKSKSPLSIHIRVVKRLMTANGWRALTDFVH